MAAARYWRLVGLETYGGGDLELSALQLHGSGARIDAAATITCSHEPSAGGLANLQDGDNGTVCRFARAAIRSGGFSLSWDFGVAVEVNGVCVGGGAAEGASLGRCTLQSFDGAGWEASFNIGRFPFPGAYTLGIALSASPPPVLLLRGNGPNGSTSIVDSSPAGRAITVNGGVIISTAQGGIGGSSLYFPGGGACLTLANTPALNFLGASVFTIETRVYVSAIGTDMGVLCNYSWVEDINYAQLIFGINPSGTLRLLLGSQDVSGAQTVPTGQFVHIAASVGATQIALSVGGVVSTFPRTATGVPSYPAEHIVGAIRGYSSFGFVLSGYLDEVRVKNGEALYSSDFTPPDTEFPIFDGAGLPFRVSTRGDEQSVAASAPLGAFSTARSRVLIARDVQHGGPGTIYGTTKTKGTPNTPTKARVVLLTQRGKTLVRETWSDPVTGAFEFRGIDTAQQFLTLAEDADGNFRPVAASMLVPEVLP